MAEDKRQYRYFPKGATIREYDDAALTVGVEHVGTQVHVIGYFRNAYKRSTFNYLFRDIKQANKFIDEQVANYREILERSQARREAMRNAERGMETGDVLKSVWGYDQTNVDFYQVVRVLGKNKVVIRQICQRTEYTSDMTGKCWPLPGQFVDDAQEMTKVARDGRVRLNTDSSASVFKPEATAEEQFETGSTFRASGWTSYA